jgi:hypothetical protein
MQPRCVRCGDSGWVCESHPDLPMDHLIAGDPCGGAGEPCPLCNQFENGERPQMPSDFQPLAVARGPFTLIINPDTASANSKRVKGKRLD